MNANLPSKRSTSIFVSVTLRSSQLECMRQALGAEARLRKLIADDEVHLIVAEAVRDLVRQRRRDGAWD